MILIPRRNQLWLPPTILWSQLSFTFNIMAIRSHFGSLPWRSLSLSASSLSYKRSWVILPTNVEIHTAARQPQKHPRRPPKRPCWMATFFYRGDWLRVFWVRIHAHDNGEKSRSTVSSRQFTLQAISWMYYHWLYRNLDSLKRSEMLCVGKYTFPTSLLSWRTIYPSIHRPRDSK